MVYVLSKNGQPIMPTQNHAKVRLLLKNGKAKVVKRTPFTIQFIETSKTYTQKVTLGIDAGSKHVGLSASTAKKELFVAELRPRNDVVKLMATRREFRRARRNRNTRHRQPRFSPCSFQEQGMACSVCRSQDLESYSGNSIRHEVVTAFCYSRRNRRV